MESVNGAEDVLEFSANTLNVSQMASVMLSNSSDNQPLEIRRIEMRRDDTSSSSTFVIVVCPMLPLVLDPHTQAQIIVHFTPSQPGRSSADLEVTAFSKDHPNLVQIIRMVGTASGPSLSPPPPGKKALTSFESEQLGILRRMEELLRRQQEETERQFEVLNSRLDRLERRGLRPEQSPSSFVPIAMPQELDIPESRPLRTFGGTVIPTQHRSPVAFPVLEQSFSVSSALSPSPSAQSNVNGEPSRRALSKTPVRFFDDMEMRTPSHRGNFDHLIHASDPYPPSLQKYTEELANRTHDPFLSSPLPSGKSGMPQFGDTELPLKLSFSEHSIVRF